MAPNRSNVGEPMSKLLDSIESRGMERDSIVRRKIERRSTFFGHLNNPNETQKNTNNLKDVVCVF